MIAPTALNGLIILAFMIIMSALWRVIAVRYADTAVGQAMATIL